MWRTATRQGGEGFVAFAQDPEGTQLQDDGSNRRNGSKAPEQDDGRQGLSRSVTILFDKLMLWY